MSRDGDPIIKKPNGDFFPHRGGRRSERHWNDRADKLNRRRLRIDPLKDGFDPGENPLDEDGPKPKKPDIPI